MDRKLMREVGLTIENINLNLIDCLFLDRLSPTICDEIFETLFYFLNSNIQPIQREILQALGYFCVTNCEYLTRSELKEYYNHLLSNLSDQNELKIMVLKNILLYLMEEELKMTRNDKDCK
jgi:cohesin loading factor subunit SCC2